MSEANTYNLSVDGREEMPFYCDECGRTYSPCYHWDNEEDEHDS